MQRRFIHVLLRVRPELFLARSALAHFPRGFGTNCSDCRVLREAVSTGGEHLADGARSGVWKCQLGLAKSNRPVFHFVLLAALDVALSWNREMPTN
jgi:hypothetical protein